MCTVGKNDPTHRAERDERATGRSPDELTRVRPSWAEHCLAAQVGTPSFGRSHRVSTKYTTTMASILRIWVIVSPERGHASDALPASPHEKLSTGLLCGLHRTHVDGVAIDRAGDTRHRSGQLVEIGCRSSLECIDLVADHQREL